MGPSKQQQGMAKVIPVARANNVSIMLTQFSNFRKGPHDIRKALVTGTSLSLERLSLLLQVRRCFFLFHHLITQLKFQTKV